MLPLVPASLSWDWYLFCGSVGKRFAVILRHALLGAICTVAQGWGVTPDLSMLSPMAATRMAGEVGMADGATEEMQRLRRRFSSAALVAFVVERGGGGDGGVRRRC